MHIGSRNRQITIQSPTDTLDGQGSISRSWSTGTQIWAEVVQIGAREFMKHEKVTPEVDTLFRIDFLDNTPSYKDRIVYNSTAYNIFGIRELGYAEGLEISAKAKSS